MKFADADIKFAQQTLVSIVRAIATKRAIEAAGPAKTATFWHVINGSLYDMAIVDWCVLFGSDHVAHQPLHWKNVFPADEFRQELYAKLGTDDGGWKTYWANLKTYRDENAAHKALNPATSHYQNMDLAVSSCDFYYEKLKSLAGQRGMIVQERSILQEYSESFEIFSRLAKSAVGATAASGEPGG